MPRIRRLALPLVLGGLILVTVSGCIAAAPGLPPEPSADAEVERIAAELDEAWSRTGLPADQRPDVEPIRVVAAFEWPEVMAKCLNAAGYPQIEVSEGKLRGGGNPESRHASFALSRYICSAQYPRDPQRTGSLSEMQIRDLYAYRVNEQAGCLRTLGFPIGEPPPEQEFVESFAAHRAWNPMQAVPLSAFAEADAQCGGPPPELLG